MAEDKNPTTQPTPEQAEDTTNLLSEAPAQDTNQTVKTDAVTTETEEGRPEWLPEKFKTPEDFAKSYTELETKISESPKAPEKYDFSFAKEMELDMNEAQEKETAEMFKNYNLTQEQAKGMLALYSDSIKAFADQYSKQGPQIDATVEHGKLKNNWGNEYDNNIASIKNFTNTLPKDTLNAPLANTAEGVQLIMDAMKYRQGQNPITDGTTAAVTGTTIRQKIADLRAGDNYKLPQGDPLGDSTRAEIYRLYQQLDRIPKE
jgi:hypothetical protein